MTRVFILLVLVTIQSFAQSIYKPYTFVTLAGTSHMIPGSSDGTGAFARFNNPYGVVADNAGNLYVLDRMNGTVRKVTPEGTVTTIAGTPGSFGATDSTDGTGSTAQFRAPQGIAIDAMGCLYVGDTANHAIRKMTPDGCNWVVTTVAGLAGSSGSADGVGAQARFNCPCGIAVDKSGNLFVADSSNNTIRKVAQVGTNWVVTTLAGLAGSQGSADGIAAEARFYVPSGIAVDKDGNIYVGELGNVTIRKINPAGEVTTLAGAVGQAGNVDGAGINARFRYPAGMSVDGDGNVYVADYDNHTIRKIAPGGEVTTWAGLGGSSGSADGVGDGARFGYPSGVALDKDGNLCVVDSGNNNIRKVSPERVVTTLAGNAAYFEFPSGVAVGSDRCVYVTDTDFHIIQKVTPLGLVTQFAGKIVSGPGGEPIGGFADGAGSDARFNRPSGICVDGFGNLYVGDSGNQMIRKVAPDGVVTSLAGSAGVAGSADGSGSEDSWPCIGRRGDTLH